MFYFEKNKLQAIPSSSFLHKVFCLLTSQISRQAINKQLKSLSRVKHRIANFEKIEIINEKMETSIDFIFLFTVL